MQQAINEGVRAIVGDAVAIRFAASVGIPGYLIESGKASIYKAIREAVSRLYRFDAKSDPLRTAANRHRRFCRRHRGDE